MAWQQSPYVTLLFLTSLITLILIVFIYRHRYIPSRNDLIRLLLAVALWAFFYALELNVVSEQDKLLWAKAAYLGIVFVPISYTLFALNFIGESPLIKHPRRTIAGLLVIPVITLLMVWTNESHHLIWTRTGLELFQGHSYLIVEHGLWFWIHTAYAYLLLVGSTYWLLRKIFITQNQYRGQITLLLLGCACPWLGNILYLTGITPFTRLDPTPFAFTATAFFFAWSLLRFSFLDVLPVARGIVLEKLEEGVIVVDELNRVIDINETAVTIMQTDKKALLGKPLALDHPQYVTLHYILQETQPAKIELDIGEAYYEVSIILLENESDEANGRLITLHNVTQRKETELLLQHAKEAAEAADQAKTNFLTNMSHEIRTPLNAVVGMAEMLRQTNLNPDQQEMINVMAQSSNDLMLLLNSILDFAKLEAGNLTLNRQTFDLVDCIEASLDNLRRAANEKHLRLTYQIEEQTPTWLVGDPVRLRQILVSLVENAIKFTEVGQIEIFIGHTLQNGSVLLQFAVKDSGIGIAADQIQHLFLPFHQVDGSITRAHGGNGLGLVICKRLVSLMGGDIHLHSAIGQGTNVHFSAQFSLATETHPPAVTLRHHKATLANKRLIVVSNDASTRRQISKEARIAGLDVYVAATSQEARYWIANSQPFDVALLETAVWQEEPGIVTQLHDSKTNALLPIILLNPDGTKLPKGAEFKTFAGCLPLPIVSSQLYDMLMNILSVSNVTTAGQEINEIMGERHPLKILLVEDNKLNRRILIKMLGKLGYKADSAANGALGVDAAAHTNYDVILMDIQMPVMDGIKATEQILASCPADKRPFIIAVTAHALEGDREYYLSVGMNEYISKPITLSQLVEVLYQSIDLKGDKAVDSQQSIVPPTLTASAGQPIDLEELANLVGENTKQFLEMMTPVFLEDTNNIMRDLTEAIQTTDGKAIQHAAHSLKGSSASMAMTKLAAYSRDLEMMTKADNLSEVPQKFQQIQVEYGRVEAALAKIVKAAV